MAMHVSVVQVLRWTARIWGTGAALVWGAFFVEHLSWFSVGSAMPPLYVWLMQALHLAMVAGLLAAWRYERVGGAIALVASVAFFASVGGARFWPLVTTTAPPALLFIYCGMRSAAAREPIGTT
jgi:hypothetical protein